MKRLGVPLVALTLSLGIVLGANAQQNNIPPPNPNCSPDGQSQLDGQHYPTNIEPSVPIWCYQQPSPIPATRISGANDWVDTFDNNGDAILQFNDHDMGYRVFDQFNGPTTGFAKGYFVNVNHWMIDFVDDSDFRLSGGVLVSPDKQFSFENGKLVVEADAAAGSDGMGGANRFYEIDVTPATAPTGVTVDGLYGYGSFGGIGAVGCRLERNDSGGNFVCAMYDNSGRVTGGECPNDGRVCKDNGGRPGRVWETQGPGTANTASSVQGGYAQWPIPGTNMHLSDVWRQCADNELDLHCRDRFRMEITKDSIHLFVNGYEAMLIDGLYAQNPSTGADNRIPDFWFAQGARPYFTSWINGGQHTPARWHWDRLAVNPHDGSGNFAAPSASPSFCLGQPNNTCPDPNPNATATATPVSAPPTTTPTPAPSTSTPTPTRVPATSTPTATATPRPSGPQTVTFNDLPANRALNGQYPAGLIDWGSNAWTISGPVGAFSSNSVAFTGATSLSQSFAFVNAHRLLQLDVYNAGLTPAVVTIACSGQTTATVTVPAGSQATLTTGWTANCSPVTITSTGGAGTHFDNLVVQ